MANRFSHLKLEQLATMKMQPAGLLALLLLSCGHMVSMEPTRCPVNLIPRLTIDGNDLTVYNAVPIHVALTSVVSKVSVSPVAMDTGAPFPTNTTIIQLGGRQRDNVVLGTCGSEAPTCVAGPVNLTLYHRKGEKEVALLIVTENMAMNCKVNATVVLTVGSAFKRGPLIIIHSDVYAEIHWGVPEGIDHVDITCCLNGSRCTRGKITPEINPTFMDIPGGKGDMQFDFYVHDTEGNIRALIGDPYFKVTTYDDVVETTVIVSKNIGWIVFLALTTSGLLTAVIIMSRKLVKKDQLIAFFKLPLKINMHNRATREPADVDVTLIKEARRDMAEMLKMRKSSGDQTEDGAATKASTREVSEAGNGDSKA